MQRLACIGIGYAFGCLLFAELVARACAGTSIFELGNKNPGMANTARSLGAVPAALCLLGDVGKVVLAAFVCHALFPQLEAPVAAGLAGIGATLGHDFPAWHAFRGGKGVATLSATIFLMSWRAGLVGAAVAVASLLLTGYLSVAAVVGAASFVLFVAVVSPGEQLLCALCVLALALAGQWSNLVGIKDGTATRDLGPRA